jgi:hypothetical protein
MESQIRALSAELLDQTASRDEIDLGHRLCRSAADEGDRRHDRHSARRTGRASGIGATSSCDSAYTLADNEEAARASNEYAAVTAEMADYLPSLVAARRSAPGDDLLTRLIEAEVDGERLTHPQEILGFFQILLVAGHETTTNLINMRSCVCSTNRLSWPDCGPHPASSPTPSRKCCAIAHRSSGCSAPRPARSSSTAIIFQPANWLRPMIGSANRDPSSSLSRSGSNIGRDPNPHIAFGHGISFCLGAALSRMEARIALD